MKPTISDIKIEPEKLEELDKILNSTRSNQGKAQAMKRIAGSGCCVCGVVPNKIVRYKMEDITRVERYCSKCFVRITATNGLDHTIAEKMSIK